MSHGSDRTCGCRKQQEFCDVIHSFIHFILLGFSRVFRSYARLAGLADSRRVAATLFRAAPRHPRKQEPSVPSDLPFPLNHYLNMLGGPSR
jgi:hypothetical protein